ncbi:MAG: hypothetical protein WA941_04490, partial [Nitrososphaeraceae archaeon]
MKEQTKTHKNLLFVAITAAALVSLVVPLSNVAQVSGQSYENLVDQINLQSIDDTEDGSFAENFARNLASFKDSSFNTLSQLNDQSIDDTSDNSFAANIGINDADFD